MATERIIEVVKDMKKIETPRDYKNCNPFDCYDALVILTRQGIVMTSTDAKLTPNEDRELFKLNKSIAERTEDINRDERRESHKKIC